MTETTNLRSYGHVLITDAETDEVLLDAYNALHPENLSEALALSLGNKGYGNINEMVFGNGASTISGTGAVTYFPPNTLGQDAQLYNQTYSKVVDDRSPSNVDPTNNKITISHVQNTTYTDVIVQCVLDRGEPSGQSSFDDASDMETDFIFDELALKSYNDNSELKRILGHIVFNPVQKSLNRAMKFKYSFRIYVA